MGLRPTKQYIVMGPATTAKSGGAATATMDCKSFDALHLNLVSSSQSTDTTADQQVKVEYGDAATGSWTAIDALDTGNDLSVPSKATGSDYSYNFVIDLRGKGRFLKLSWETGNATTQNVCAIANLFRADEVPDDASSAGDNCLVFEEA